jgi:hypothetical protein
MMLGNARTRARVKGLPFDITAEYLDTLLVHTCPILGIPLVSHKGRKGPRDDSPSLDRIVPEKGYVRGNVVVISGRANRIKSDASFKELRAVADFYGEFE